MSARRSGMPERIGGLFYHSGFDRIGRICAEAKVIRKNAAVNMVQITKKKAIRPFFCAFFQAQNFFKISFPGF